MKNFTIVTVDTKNPLAPYYCRDEFYETCKRYGHKPLVLGTVPGEFRGLGTKPKLVKKAIDAGLVKTPYMIFADCFDVVFAKDPQVIVDTMVLSALHDGCQIVWNGERNYFPEEGMRDAHPKCKTSFRFMNSGLAVGYTQSFLDALEEMDADNLPDDYVKEDGSWQHFNDQTMWQKQFIYGSVPMRLDSRCDYFQTLHDVGADEMDFDGEEIINKETKTTPMVFHMNGGGKGSPMRELILRHLGLEK